MNKQEGMSMSNAGTSRQDQSGSSPHFSCLSPSPHFSNQGQMAYDSGGDSRWGRFFLVVSAQGVAIRVGQMGSPGQGSGKSPFQPVRCPSYHEGTLEWVPEALAPAWQDCL